MTNCGKNAEKKSKPLGFDNATNKLRIKARFPDAGGANLVGSKIKVTGADRHNWQESQNK